MSTKSVVDTRQFMAEAKFFESYSRFDDNMGRYETWDEAVDRVMTMHEGFYKDKNNEIKEYIEEARKAYKDKRVLGAQRALQFGGEQIIKHQMKMYNCTSSYADRAEFFGEIFYILLCGAGAGFSVQKHHIAKLPEITARNKQPKTHVVGDSIEGWGTSVDVLLSSYFVNGGKHPEYAGRKVFFDTSQVRDKNAMISGGFKAPGPDGLRLALDRIEHLLQRLILVEGVTKLLPIHVYDIVMHLADAVLSGGVRRSATICLFSPDDKQMMTAKTGNWYSDNPQRARSNNSAVIVRDEATREQFAEIMHSVKEFGEPGFVFVESTEHTTNPCFTGDTVVAVADGRNGVSIRQLAEENKPFPVYSAHLGPHKKWVTDVQTAIAFKTGTRNTIKLTLSDGTTVNCTPEHKLMTPSGSFVLAKDSLNSTLEGFFTSSVKNYRRINSFTNAYNNQHRMIWEYFNGSIDKGYVIDHIAPNTPDFVDNLQIMSTQNHNTKTGTEGTGKNNPVFSIADTQKWKQNLSNKSFLEGNPNFNGITNEELIENAKLLHNTQQPITFENLSLIDDRTPKSFSKNRFGGSIHNLRAVAVGDVEYIEPSRIAYLESIEEACSYINPIVISIEDSVLEDVYDLKVENNSNFYILTSGDENWENSSGILVHNCVEIGMFPQIDDASGWQGCNLTEINGGMCNTEEDFYIACSAAAVLGTLQAGYTDFKFISDTSKKIFEREALIGCSITGWMNNPKVLFDERILQKGAIIIKEVNKELAAILGINPAARTTCVKPSGNASIQLMTAAGIHGEHAEAYLRHVQLNKETEVAQLIARTNPAMIEEAYSSASKTDFVVAFPIVPIKGSLFKDDLLGVAHLEKIKLVQQNWIEAGTNVELCADKGVRHNVSNTIIVDDWDEVEEYVFANRHFFAGISFMPQSGDKAYNQAPNTAVIGAKEIVKKYGTAAVFASGLIVDGLASFENLWVACTAGNGFGPDLSFDSTENTMKRDWIRRYKKFADNYLKGDPLKAEHCLKDVYLLHKWEKIQKNFVPIDWVENLHEKKYTAVDTLGAVACQGGQCEIDF